MDIQQTNVLNVQQAREHEDEKHIAPLQLDVIERALILWSNPGDMVFSPFMGIGSEGYMSLKNNRKFTGIELKEKYFDAAVGHLVTAERSAKSWGDALFKDEDYLREAK
jgi:DNA modification methylase